jgi:hypothetical protein
MMVGKQPAANDQAGLLRRPAMFISRNRARL